MCSAFFECPENCVNSQNYLKDKHFGAGHCRVAQTEQAIQREIMAHGSVFASFDVFESFHKFNKTSSPVYCAPEGNYDKEECEGDRRLKSIGGHAIRLVSNKGVFEVSKTTL